jgi:hypothetical protein
MKCNLIAADQPAENVREEMITQTNFLFPQRLSNERLERLVILARELGEENTAIEYQALVILCC